MPEYGIAFGSNLGDRLAHFKSALALLTAGVPPNTVRQSPVYATDPVGCPEGAPEFFNAVVVFDDPRPPTELHTLTRSIESSLGRAPESGRPHGEARPIDLDLLFAGDSVIDSPGLVLPHPRLHQRRFVLQPLADLLPDLVLPGLQFPVFHLLDQLDSGEPPLTLVTHHWP